MRYVLFLVFQALTLILKFTEDRMMTIWKPRISASAHSKYLGIVDALEEDIYAGYIKAGDRLPSQRRTAARLGIDLTTVTRAFTLARSRGLIESEPGRGSFIRQHVESRLISHISDRRPVLDLSMNSPPQPATADLQQHIPAGIARLISGADRVLQLQYQESAGHPQDRSIASAWLNQALPGVEHDRTVITAGAQAAIFGLLSVVTRPGDTIACGHFVYPGLKSAAALCGVNLVPVAMDADGIVPASFAEVCEHRSIQALYVVPVMDNPTAATLGQQRRDELAGIANQHHVTLIEDDPYSLLEPQPLPPMAGLIPARSWYIRTLAKCVTPALRIAYVVAPSTSQAMQLAAVLRAASVMASPLMASLASQWIQDGRITRFAEAISDENRLRQEIAFKHLGDFDYQANPCGHHGWLTLPGNWQATEFARQATNAGVVVVEGSEFSVDGHQTNAVRISLGLLPDHEAVDEALAILAMLLRSDMLPAGRIV